MRGYISSTGSVAWPHPKVCTQRSAWIVSAMTSAAFFYVFELCVFNPVHDISGVA